MNILVIGSESSFNECQKKFGSSFKYTRIASHQAAKPYLDNNDLVFDFILDEDPYELDVYRQQKGLPVFVNAPKLSLAEVSYLFNHEIECTIYGFNGLPGFLNRPILELSLLNEEHSERIKTICSELNTGYQLVADRVGMVTPRVICMIINEAYYTLQEGTANKEAIDLGMKLGTAYPYGPFEWTEKIGLQHVYELLEAMYEDTKDERYKICPLLKKEYLMKVTN